MQLACWYLSLFVFAYDVNIVCQELALLRNMLVSLLVFVCL